MKLDWYKGISEDKRSAISGDGVVLHSDQNVCRILSYSNGVFSLRCYRSFLIQAIELIDRPDPNFSFNDFHYEVEAYNIIEFDDANAEFENIYKKYCDKQVDPFDDLRTSTVTYCIYDEEEVVGTIEVELKVVIEEGQKRVIDFDIKDLVIKISSAVENHISFATREDKINAISDIMKAFLSETSSSLEEIGILFDIDTSI